MLFAGPAGHVRADLGDESQGGIGPDGVDLCEVHSRELVERQALEKALDTFWSENAPSAGQSSRRSQLLCLGTYLADRTLTRRVAQAWSALSHACHHQPYDLPPTTGELEGWMESVQIFIERTAE